MTSLEIAELSGKNHKDVMRAIRNMEDAWEKINGRNFALVEYRDVKGELRPCYNLTKTECLYIATKFNESVSVKCWAEKSKVPSAVNVTVRPSSAANCSQRVSVRSPMVWVRT